MPKLLPIRHWCVAGFRYLSSNDKFRVLSRSCHLKLGSLPPHAFRVMRHWRSSRTRPQISVIIQATSATCRPAPRTSAKYSFNGTEAPDQNCKSDHFITSSIKLLCGRFSLAITYGSVITADALNVFIPSQSRD